MNGVGRGDNKENKGKNALFTRETVGMTLLLFSVIIFFIAVTGRYVSGDIGVAITSFFVGFCGFFVYPLLILCIYASVALISGKRYFPAAWVVKCVLLLVAVFFIVHTATAERFFGNGYGSYLGGCWSAASESALNGTGGGVLFGLVAYPVRALLSAAGAYVLFAILLAAVLFWIAMGTPLRRVVFRSAPRKRAEDKAPAENAPVPYDDIPAPARTAALPEEGRPAYGAPAAPVYAQNVQAPGAYARPAQNMQAPGAYPRNAAPAQPANAPAAQQPVYRTAPSPYTQPAQAYRQPVRTESPKAGEPPQSSRDILFRSDPASSYKNNLIFDRDSRFNTYPRRSSVTPVQDEPSQTAQPAQNVSRASGQPPRYSEAYTARAEESRPAMPRRVTVERPAEPAEDDFNYPQSPSYRAPAQSAAEKHDYYSNDVPYADEPDDYEETFSSEPNVNDYEAPAAAAEVPAEPEEEPARPTYEAPAELDTPVRPSYRAEPARPAYEEPRTPVRPVYGEESAARREEPEEEPAEPVEDVPAPEDLPPMTREEFRSVFSRPVEERIRISDTPAPRDIPNVPPARDRFVPPAEEPAEEPPAEEPPARSRVYDAPAMRSAADLLDDDDDAEMDDANYLEDDGASALPARSPRDDGRALAERTERAPAERASRVPATPAANESEPAPAPKKHVYKAYVRPSLESLVTYQEKPSVSQEEIDQNSAIIVETLSAFRVDAEVVKVTVGSAVTRYDIDIPRNVTVNTVIKRDTEIAMRLHARDGVNIYSNSEAGAVSIEVPNSRRATVGLKSVMQADEYVNAKPNSLMFAMGKDVEGRNVCGNIVKMKHLLVAGATGSGKSVCLNSMLISLICRYSPEELRLILIDPKKVEFAVFDGLPHLMINEIISDAQKAISALNWALKEQERRYTLFQNKTRSGINVHNIDEYNRSLTEDEEKLPKIVIVVDELADLMSVAKKEIEERIQRLSQKARAAGMHLVIATQRPSVDVITGVIKGNLPTRLAFRVIQEVDSRTILDESGAQKLLGNGDMLYRTEGMFDCVRVQGAFVGSDEVQKIIEDIKAHNEAYFDENVADFINREESGSAGGGGEDADDSSVDPQYIKALAIVVKLGQASISLIQRKCSVGYNHAGKIIEWMELMGYISAFDGKAKARTVLLSKEDFEAKYGDLD